MRIELNIKCPFGVQWISVSKVFKSLFLYYITTANFKSYLDQFKEAIKEINQSVDEQRLHFILTGA